MRLARLLDALRLLGGGHLGLRRRARRRPPSAAPPRRRAAPRAPPRTAPRAPRWPRARSRSRLPSGRASDCASRDAPLDLGHLGGEALELRGHAPAVLAEEGDLLLERLHVAVGGVERALELGELVRLLVVAAAQFLERALGVAQPRGLGLEAHLDLLHLVRVAVPRLLRLAQPRVGEQVVVERQLRLQVLVARGHLRLLGEALELAVQLGADVAHPLEVLARVLEAQLRLAAALAVLGHARGLLEEDAQLLRLGGDDARDHALLDDRVGARPQARAEEDVLHVAAAHVLAVDVVAGVAVAREHALHADLGVLRPRAAHAPQRVVEDELHRGPAHRLAVGRAVEDHVVHVLAAQLLRARLAEHPAHRVDHVGLAAAVGADHAHQLAGNGDLGRVDEGLETGKLDGS